MAKKFTIATVSAVFAVVGLASASHGQQTIASDVPTVSVRMNTGSVDVTTSSTSGGLWWP